MLFLIAQGKRSSDADGAAGYAHAAALPLEVWVECGGLCIKPIDEVTDLRDETVIGLENANSEQLNAALSNVNDGVFEILIEMENEDFTVFIGKKTLSYYKQESTFGFRGDEYSGGTGIVKAEGDTITLRIIVDRSLVECFFDEQSYCATRVYTKNEFTRKVSVMTDSVIKAVTVYRLR